MNPIAFAMRRPLTSLVLFVALVGGGVVGLNERRAGTGTPQNASMINVCLDYIGANAKKAKEYITSQLESHSGAREEPSSEANEGPSSEAHEGQSHEEHQKIVATSPMAKDVTITEPYVCQIRSRRHIEVCALERGYLEEILVQEGQAVKKGDLMFKILPTLYQANLDAEMAEAQLAQLKFNNTKALCEKKIVSPNEVALLKAELAKAQAKAKLAGAELNFTNVTAPFDGIVDRLHEQLGSLIDEGDVLTTLSDNSVMWVYFNVREARYLEYMAEVDQHSQDEKIELMLADGSIFPETGKIGAIEAKFNNETGNIPFRADFPNPKRLLRHGQTGTVLIHRTLKDAVVIPQRATFELLDKQYVYVVGEDHVAHQRLITIQHELEDTYVIKSGLGVNDRIVLEGIREVRDGNKVDNEFRKPEEVLVDQKFHAE